jgi:heme exporter protein CcmD
MSMFDMGAYGAFVWPAYAVSVIGLGAVVIWTLRAYARARTRLAALEKP